MARTSFRIIAVAFLILAVAGAIAAGGASKGLKYQFKPGETYVYSVNIVGELGQATQTSKGTIQLTGKAADGNQMQLTPYVNIATSIKQPASSGKTKGPKGGPSGGPFGKGPSGMKIVGAREVVIDAFGKVLKFNGETSLPLLMGTAEELVIEPLSAAGENRWQTDKDLVVREGERAPKGPPRTTETNTAAKEIVTYEVTGSTGNLTNIKKTYSLKTASADGTSRIQFDGAGDLVFDTQAGMLKSGEFKGAILVSDKNINITIPITATYTLMSQAEAAALKKQQDEAKEKAIQAAKDRTTPKPGTADVDVGAALTDLKSGNKTSVRKAADLLSTATMDAARRDEVAKELAPLLKDQSLRLQVSKALKVWGTDKALAPMLKDPDQFVRNEVCKILAEVGTSECLPALRAALTDSSALVRREAQNAGKTIELRQQKK